MYDVIVIGNGPAGISASLYLKRANFNVAVVGKAEGALVKADKVENYYGFSKPIQAKKLLHEGIKQAKYLGIDVIIDEVISIIQEENKFKVKTIFNNYDAKCLILATGTNRRTPNIKGIKEFEGRRNKLLCSM